MKYPSVIRDKKLPSYLARNENSSRKEDYDIVKMNREFGIIYPYISKNIYKFFASIIYTYENYEYVKYIWLNQDKQEHIDRITKYFYINEISYKTEFIRYKQMGENKSAYILMDKENLKKEEYKKRLQEYYNFELNEKDSLTRYKIKFKPHIKGRIKLIERFLLGLNLWLLFKLISYIPLLIII